MTIAAQWIQYLHNWHCPLRHVCQKLVKWHYSYSAIFSGGGSRLALGCASSYVSRARWSYELGWSNKLLSVVSALCTTAPISGQSGETTQPVAASGSP
jgi:hypothetical protein